jgi:hypothetical protein
MNETMLARLARTLDEIAKASDGQTSRQTSRSIAVLLLTAMRDPTENMAIAGGEAIPRDEIAIHSEVAKDVWRAMVEDALANDDG